MCSACITICAGRVEQRGRGVAALLDVRRVGRAHQHGAHLVADRAQAAEHHLEGDRVEACALIARAPATRRAVLVDVRGPSGRHDHRRLRELQHGRAGAAARPVPRGPRSTAVSSARPSNTARRVLRCSCAPVAPADGGRRTLRRSALTRTFTSSSSAVGVARSRSGRACACSKQLAQLGHTGVGGRRHRAARRPGRGSARRTSASSARARHAGAASAGELARPPAARALLRPPPPPSAHCAPTSRRRSRSRARAPTARPRRAGRARARTPSSSARRAACIGPAPPNATSA